VARTQIKVKIANHNFKEYQNKPGVISEIGIIVSKKGIGSQPPKKIKTNKFDITITCKYSPRNKNAKVIEEYSTLNPDTNSDSASAKSKGAR
jgi:hypothetical protein